MTTTTAPVEALRECPFCGEPLLLRGFPANPYGRCETEGCYMHERKIAIPLDAVDQVKQWNRRALTASPATDEGTVKSAHSDLRVGPHDFSPSKEDRSLCFRCDEAPEHAIHTPETDEGTLKRGNGTGGWTIDTDLLRAIRDDAGEWAKESYLETVQAIALAVERHLSRARVAPATDDIGRLVEELQEALVRVEPGYIAPLPRETLARIVAALLSQQSENNRLREAVEPFAAAADNHAELQQKHKFLAHERESMWNCLGIEIADLDHARAALPKAST